MKCKTLSVFLCLLLAFSLLPCPASAENLIDREDLLQSVDTATAVTIILDDENTAAEDPVTVETGVVTITEPGTYVLTGTLRGQIVVDAGKNDSVTLVLDNARIGSDSNAAILVRKAEKVTVFLAEESENVLANGGSFDDESNADAVLYSKSDLVLKGGGSLTVLAEAGHGIVSKRQLFVTGGSYVITAAAHGLVGKDGIAVSGGSFLISAGEDGLHAKNSDDPALGCIELLNGEFTVTSSDDGISATGPIRIEDGSFTITSGGGSANGTMKASDSMGMGWGRGGFEPGVQETAESGSTAKGIVSDRTITIQGGSFVLDCADDAVHCDENLTILGGDWTIRTADDAIHSEADVQISGGSFRIPYCYEGIEGNNVTIDDGIFDIVSNDDGINAAGGADSSGFRTPGIGGDHAITIHGGSITIVSDGDCLDSNGSIVADGGTLNLTCNGNGNTAIDSETGFTNNGADVTTNDGSENGGGMMFGGMGGRGPFGDRGDFGAPGAFGNPGDFDGQSPGNRPSPGSGNGYPPDVSGATPPQQGSFPSFGENVG